MVEFRKPDRTWIKPGSRLKQHFSFQKGSSSQDQFSQLWSRIKDCVAFQKGHSSADHRSLGGKFNEFLDLA